MIEGVVTVYMAGDIVLSKISAVIVPAVVLETVAFSVVCIAIDDVVKSVSTVDSVVEIGNAAVVGGVSSEDVVSIEEAAVSSVKNVENVVLGVSLNVVLVAGDKGVVVVIFIFDVGTTVLKEVISTDLSVAVESVLEIAVYGVPLSVVFVINGVVVVNFNVGIVVLTKVAVAGVEVIKVLSVVSVVTFVVNVV